MNLALRLTARLVLVAPVAMLLVGPSTHAANESGTWFMRSPKVFVAPDRGPIVNGVVVVRDGTILAVGEEGTVEIPAGARQSKCSGGIIAAGFQNSHVHFMGDAWNAAARQPAAELSGKIVTMLTRYGYSTVVDTGSDRDNTLALRTRILRGEVAGPRILTSGLPLFPPNGIPVYLDHLPRELLERLPQPASADAAVKAVRDNLDAGSDVAKLFIATPQTGRVQRMQADIARAAAAEAHRRGKLVLAHPTDIAGVEAALEAGVDILAHTTHGVESPWPDALLRRAIGQGVSLVPTLKLMGHELKKENVPPAIATRLTDWSVAHVRSFAAAGGQVLFGTDVGYMSDFDPAEEYVLMAKAGLSPAQILASLTIAPAARWNEGSRRGRVATGMDADLVVLDADPMVDAANFARVRCTISLGRTVFPLAELR